MYINNSRINKIVAAPNTTAVQVTWDPTFFATDRGAGFAIRPGKDGSQGVVAAWQVTKLGPDTVVDMSKSDVYQKAITSIFAEAVARNEAALAELKSNYPMDKRYEAKNGTFDFVYDRPGTDQDLRYVGVLEAAPAPIREILVAATGFRKHI